MFITPVKGESANKQSHREFLPMTKDIIATPMIF